MTIYTNDSGKKPSPSFVPPASVKETDMYEKCKEGLHPLKEISRTSDGFTDKVVRWCPVCGAIVIDMECDGRVYAGRYQKMVLPTLAKRLDRAEQCIYAIEDALDRGNDNDWAREAIRYYENEIE